MQDEPKDRAAISRSKIGGETPMVVSEIADTVLYSGFFGALDSARVQIITEKILEMTSVVGAEHVIIDVSTLESIDSSVAGRLVKLSESVRLLGAEVVFCGIRPIIAQTMGEVGTNLGVLVIKKDLKTALDYVYMRQGLMLVKREGGPVEVQL